MSVFTSFFVIAAALFLGSWSETTEQVPLKENTVWRVCAEHPEFASLRSAVVRPTGLQKVVRGETYWKVYHVRSRSSLWISTQSLCESHVKNDVGLVVDTQSNTLLLIRGDELQQSFPVGTGRRADGFESPQGIFKIGLKERCPLYYGDNPSQPVAGCDPRNPLGKAAMWFLGRTYGIHGTHRPELISGARTSAAERRVSKGCVRLNNNHIDWLYKRIHSGTPLWIMNGMKNSDRGGSIRVVGHGKRLSTLLVRLDPGTRSVKLEQLSTGARFHIGGGDTSRIRFFAKRLPVGSVRGAGSFRQNYLRNGAGHYASLSDAPQ